MMSLLIDSMALSHFSANSRSPTVLSAVPNCRNSSSRRRIARTIEPCNDVGGNRART